MHKVLTLTSLFPNPAHPSHGAFVRQRLKQLWQGGHIESRVVAPVPWYPSFLPRAKRYERFVGIPQVREEQGVTISHPRYLTIPAVGMTVAPALMAAGIYRHVRDIHRSGFKFDLIDAHYFYPDGVAAAIIAKRLGVPFVITARGTDINLIPEYRLPRRQILWAASRASHIVTVCEALRERIIDLGVEPDKVTTLRNGVDPAIFHPVDPQAARQRLDIEGKTLLAVGILTERKGHHLVIEAMRELEDFNLIVVGSGIDEDRLKRQAAEMGVASRVRFDGEVDQEALRDYYNACDAFVLASSREGMANVLLESLSCGTPVAATNIWGTPEVVRDPAAGILFDERSAEAIARGVISLFDGLPERAATLTYAEQYRWEPTTAGQLEIFDRIVAKGGSVAAESGGLRDATE